MKAEKGLSSRHCKPCHGETEPVPLSEAEAKLTSLRGWKLTDGGKAIRREWTVKDFAEGMQFLNRVAEIAEEEDHHPDLCLENYRDVAIVLSTHAIRGLSDNDFIMAAKIDELPVELWRR
ncbi:MAG: 4a-hydroxytetrahydrobiopterin dehydratase [Planctomycetaceae bacterium]